MAALPTKKAGFPKIACLGHCIKRFGMQNVIEGGWFLAKPLICYRRCPGGNRLTPPEPVAAVSQEDAHRGGACPGASPPRCTPQPSSIWSQEDVHRGGAAQASRPRGACLNPPTPRSTTCCAGNRI